MGGRKRWREFSGADARTASRKPEIRVVASIAWTIASMAARSASGRKTGTFEKR
jgi:hypothetical protein